MLDIHQRRIFPQMKNIQNAFRFLQTEYIQIPMPNRHRALIENRRGYTLYLNYFYCISCYAENY